MAAEGQQMPLFTAAETGGTYRVRSQPRSLTISRPVLQAWKQRVFEFQQQVKLQAVAQQPSLFATQSAVEELAQQIDPFSLPRQNIEFWRKPVTEAGVAAYYFVIDDAMPLLLYVGETIQSNQRWKGEHDCKRYVQNYVEAHRSHGILARVNISFYHWAPEQTRDRQQLETVLIDQWRSPFNKQNWTFWQTPFVVAG